MASGLVAPFVLLASVFISMGASNRRAATVMYVLLLGLVMAAASGAVKLVVARYQLPARWRSVVVVGGSAAAGLDLGGRVIRLLPEYVKAWPISAACWVAVLVLCRWAGTHLAELVSTQGEWRARPAVIDGP